MTTYTINDLEKISGIKAHTIRIWEKRYGLFNPSRSSSNCRVYTETDVDLLKGILVLKQDGMKISHIARMPHYEIDHVASCCCQRKSDVLSHEEVLSTLVIGFKPKQLSQWIDSRFEQLGVRRAMLDEIFPLQNKMHLLKMSGQVNRVQEEMVRQTIIRKLAAAIDGVEKKNPEGEDFALVFVPGCNKYISSSMFLHYLLASMGYQVINLCQVTSIEDIGRVLSTDDINIKLIVTVLAENFCQYSTKDYLGKLSNLGEGCQIMVSGYQTKSMEDCQFSNITVKKSLSALADGILSLKN